MEGFSFSPLLSGRDRTSSSSFYTGNPSIGGGSGGIYGGGGGGFNGTASNISLSGTLTGGPSNGNTASLAAAGLQKEGEQVSLLFFPCAHFPPSSSLNYLSSSD